MAGKLSKPDAESFDVFIRAQATDLRADDPPPSSLMAWEQRRVKLRDALFTAMGTLPAKPCPLEPKVLDTIQRKGYRIEKLVFQSQPDVWVTANAYILESVKGKRPAVLVVHGHWPWARRDPVVQARCLGLMHLGFFVLAVDALGAGERYTNPCKGTYHGALYGSTLWPAGLTLLGQQVYDNRRAVDYLVTRPEVDAKRLGITGASGGGNQTMYAGALDERFGAVVPVCSVGNYQAYLKAACCVCEVLPGALRFSEEGEVLGLVAPRALMVISADQDAFQFSVTEAKKSLRRAEAIFQLHACLDKIQHKVFESKHDYNRPMREAMYGWMTRWLKEEGKGKAIAEPAHEVEKPEDLSCFPGDKRPKSFLFIPALAARTARSLLAKFKEHLPDHVEAWESLAVYMRSRLRKQVFGDFPKLPKPVAEFGAIEKKDDIQTTSVLLTPEKGLVLSALLLNKKPPKDKQKACILLHLDGKAVAVKHPLAAALLDKGFTVLAPDLRATGAAQPEGERVHDAGDHNSTEHALWIGRPLLGQWAFDVLTLLDWLAIQPGLDKNFTVAGIGPASLVALCAGGLFEDRVGATILIDSPATLVTEEAYGSKMRMGLLAPGILGVGDVPHLAALVAPRRLILSGGVLPFGTKLKEKDLEEGYGFTEGIYKLYKAKSKLTVSKEFEARELPTEID